jgi:hypothetical protein
MQQLSEAEYHGYDPFEQEHQDQPTEPWDLSTSRCNHIEFPVKIGNLL